MEYGWLCLKQFIFFSVNVYYTHGAPNSLLLLSFEIRREEEKKAHTQLVLSWFIRNNLLYFVLCSGKRFWKTIYCWVVSFSRFFFFCFFFYSLRCILIVLPSFSLCVYMPLCNFTLMCWCFRTSVSMSASVWARKRRQRERERESKRSVYMSKSTMKNAFSFDGMCKSEIVENGIRTVWNWR